MAKTDNDDDLNPAIRRTLGEAAAHGAEAARLVAEMARPSRAPHGFAEIEAELTPLRSQIEELQRRAREPTNPDIHVHLDSRPDPGSEPPSGEAMSVQGPGGLKMRRAPAWLVLVLGLAAIVAAGMAYVAGKLVEHPRPDAVPVTAPIHS